MEKYDLVVVGAGAAGLTAAIYSVRLGLSTLVLSKDLGGQAATTIEVENYPGLPLIEGIDLMNKFANQVEYFGGKIIYEEVCSIQKDENSFLLSTLKRKVMAESIILAFGKTPNDLGISGEDKFKGTNIQSMVCDLNYYKGKVVAVIGGASSAAQSAINLSRVASKVIIICRGAAMRGERILLDRLAGCVGKVEVVVNSCVQSFEGHDHLEKLVVKVGSDMQEIKVDEALIAIGYSNQTGWVKDLVEIDGIGQIIVGADCSTATNGVFAAGDVTTIPYKQIIISAGEGAKAALSASRYIAKKRGKIPSNIDWGISKRADWVEKKEN